MKDYLGWNDASIGSKVSFVGLLLFIIVYVGGLLFLAFSPHNNMPNDNSTAIGTPIDNATAVERKINDLRQTEKDYFFIMEDNRVARVLEVKKQGEDTVKVFYSVKGDQFNSHKRIGDLETHIQKVIKKSDVIEWQKAKAEYDRDSTKPIGFKNSKATNGKIVQGISGLKIFHKENESMD